MSSNKLPGKRSFTGNHPLLPAMGPEPTPFIPKIPTYSFLKWTFGRGSVIWKIWPAVLLHTLFATLVVYVWVVTGRRIDIPNVMLTVMGVVIGFVISYRAMSGYDRYWMGRTAWADVIRNARTMGRLIWYHVPPALKSGPRADRSLQEQAKVMAEKRMALDLVEAFAVALKHHLRGELGIYFVDLYDLVRPLHDFTDSENPHPTVASSAVPALLPSTFAPPAATASGVASSSISSDGKSHAAKRPSATPVSSTLQPTLSAQANASQISLRQPLLPAMNPAPEDGVLRRVSPEVIPFAGLFTGLVGWVRSWWKDTKADMEGRKNQDRSSRIRVRQWGGPIHPQGVAQLEEFEKGENLPEEVLRCLSEWISVLEERGTVPGTSLGSILGGVMQFEISLTTLEHILTTPLPFVYSVHIRVVWLYLFLLPLQLVSDFGWHTVPAVLVGSFVYLGFIAAGEEIEQPFGYEDNDLDLDMFCRDIIRQDLQCLKKARGRNAWFPPAPAAVAGPVAAAASTSGSNGNGKAKAEAEDSGLTPTHAYGGNMYRASLSSLSDTLSLEEAADEEVDAETEGGEGGDAAQAQAHGNGEAVLVDVR
ncbi:Bestrophin, RFP-TM, chloride channel-domain-containing protein [Mycena galericulata]|nr:Bestrophin, RFP-TM, chloride channel-domain-containing protein [Mycena galericulata]